MFTRIQHIRSVIGDHNIFINGDIVAREEALTRIASQLLRRELDILTQEARERLLTAVDEFVNAVINKIDKANLSSKLEEFSHPSTQFALYAALKGYATSETIEQQELLVDAFIERIQEEWDSAEKMIIDSALVILPKLTPKMLSALGLMQLRHQMTKAPFGFFMNQYFGNLTPLAEQMSNVDALDIEYLKQEKLILPLPGMSQTALELGTVMPIHRHRKTSETICMVRGKMVMRLCDDKGNVTDEFVMEPCGEHPMVQVEAGQWHSLEVLDGRIRQPNLSLSKGGEVWRVGAAWKRRAN